MAAEYKLSYTAQEIDEKLGRIDQLSEEIPSAIETALAEAKASGEFKGDKGDPGYTPQKGTDYWTNADRDEMINAVLSALPAWEGGSY